MRRPRTATMPVQRAAAAVLLMLALVAPTQPATAVRIPGGSDEQGGEQGGGSRSGDSSTARRSYLRRPSTVESPLPAVLVDDNSSGGGSNRREATSAPAQESATSALDLLRRVFLGLAPDPNSQPDDAAEQQQQPAFEAERRPAPQIQNPKASPLPVPPIEGLEAEEEEEAAAAAGGGDARGLRHKARLHIHKEAPPQQCFPTLQWTSVNGELRVNGQPFHLKGTNWFGFETAKRVAFGLDEHDMDYYFRFLAEHKFNALRVPVSVDFALDPDGLPDKEAEATAIDPAIKGLNHFHRLDAFLNKAAEHNLLVMLDMHILDPAAEIPPLWYDANHTMVQYLQAWDNVLTIFGAKWNVFAIDLKNEPHGKASWAAGKNSTDWNRAAEIIGKHVAAKFPQFTGLFFVGGIEHPTTTGGRAPLDKHSKPWGGDLEGVYKRPIDLGKPEWNDRVVYSPHVYGPSVFDRDYFNYSKGFPKNMPDIWEAHWAFVENLTGRAAVIGEWGGKMSSLTGSVGKRDKAWHAALADYLVEHCLEDTFYWCLNPNSGDTGGLLSDDWTSPDEDKLALLERVQPNPSAVTRQTDGQICLTPGAYANAACQKR